jgi:hypothetical protein
MFWTGPRSLTVTCPRAEGRQLAAPAETTIGKLMLSPAAAKTGCEAMLAKLKATATAIAMAAVVETKRLILFVLMDTSLTPFLWIGLKLCRQLFNQVMSAY